MLRSVNLICVAFKCSGIMGLSNSSTFIRTSLLEVFMMIAAVVTIIALLSIYLFKMN